MHFHFTQLLALNVALSCSHLHAEVKANTLFTDGAVLQHGQKIPVWGSANNGEKVTVEFAGQKISTLAQGGKWKLELSPVEAGGPFTMKISGDNITVLKDLLVGEVWVASGQSNMQWRVNESFQPELVKTKAHFPQIRMITVKRTFSQQAMDEVQGSWQKATPETVGDFSAVAYHFARHIHENLNVPVGIISSSWGGTPAEAWTRSEVFGKFPELSEYLNPSSLSSENPQLKILDHQMPSVLYNAMISPLIPYPIKGVIWYQGESNAKKAKQYETLFPAMIADWRGQWGLGDFPFLYVQIAPFKGIIPEIREAQLKTLGRSKNTAMVVSTDYGDANDIHPKQKEPIGQRLSLAARALAYGQEIEYSGPLFDSMELEKNKINISFKHVGEGLTSKDGDLKGFSIAGEDGNFIPAVAKIKGDKVEVFSKGIRKPKAVRYGWSNVPDGNLYNKVGLPASPFRASSNEILPQ